MVKCGDWGCTPNPDSSHINGIHIKGVWQPLYAVEVHTDVSQPRYGRSACRPSFWKFARNLGKNSQAITHGEMRCTPNPYSSDINGIHIKGVWQPSYATMDGDMDSSLCLSTTNVSPDFGSRLKSRVTAWCWMKCLCSDVAFHTKESLDNVRQDVKSSPDRGEYSRQQGFNISCGGYIF